MESLVQITGLPTVLVELIWRLSGWLYEERLGHGRKVMDHASWYWIALHAESQPWFDAYVHCWLEELCSWCREKEEKGFIYGIIVENQCGALHFSSHFRYPWKTIQGIDRLWILLKHRDAKQRKAMARQLGSAFNEVPGQEHLLATPKLSQLRFR